MLDQLSSTLSTAKEALGQTDGLLESLEQGLDTVHTDVVALGESDAFVQAFGEDGLDAAKIADFMGSPTELVTEPLYELNAYGSAMAPLFMNLTFWIGAFMLLVIMKQEVDGEGIRNLTVTQRYLGPLRAPGGAGRPAGGGLLRRRARSSACRPPTRRRCSSPRPWLRSRT